MSYGNSLYAAGREASWARRVRGWAEPVHPAATLRQAQVIEGGWGETREVSRGC